MHCYIKIIYYQCFEFWSGWIRVFSPIRFRTLKTRIRICPLTNQWDLNDVFDFFGGNWPKRTVLTIESAKFEINKFSSCNYSFRTVFFHWSGFSADLDPDPDSGKKVRFGSGNKPGTETLYYYYFIIDKCGFEGKVINYTRWRFYFLLKIRGWMSLYRDCYISSGVDIEHLPSGLET